jgi:MFS family permease
LPSTQSTDWASLLSRTHRNCSACATCPHISAPASDDRRTTRLLPAVSGTVWALGVTSFFTDISSEMVASVLPMYLVLQFGMQPLAFGVIDGLYQGVAAVVRVAAGVVGDRWRRHKEVAVIGYALSMACRIALVAAGSGWSAITAIVTVDRIGKGIRTAPRDALISLRSPCRGLATAFGVHRAFDAGGAMLGPLVAFLLLAQAPRRFDVLFVTSAAVAFIGLASIVLLVDGGTNSARAMTPPVSVSRSLGVLRARRFRAILIAGLVLGIPTMSDAFIFLSLQRQHHVAAVAFPLFYVATSLFTAMFAVPLGRLADRYGRTPVLLGGYVSVAVVYVMLCLPQTTPFFVLVPLALLGAYYAATDGVLTAMAAAALPPSASGTGLSLLATATNVSKLVASVLFGVIWSAVGLGPAITSYLGALVLAILGAGMMLLRTPD